MVSGNYLLYTLSCSLKDIPTISISTTVINNVIHYDLSKEITYYQYKMCDLVSMLFRFNKGSSKTG